MRLSMGHVMRLSPGRLMRPFIRRLKYRCMGHLVLLSKCRLIYLSIELLRLSMRYLVHQSMRHLMGLSQCSSIHLCPRSWGPITSGSSNGVTLGRYRGSDSLRLSFGAVIYLWQRTVIQRLLRLTHREKTTGGTY